jgi:anti-sigma factor RsiW
MTCDDLRDLIEPLASGDLTPTSTIAAHLASCSACTAALGTARRIDELLRRRPAPPAPAHFTSRVMARVRRARWRSEQALDLAFNIGLVAAAIAIVIGIWIAVERTGLASVSREVFQLFMAGLVTAARQMAPSLPLYAAATVLLASALGLWWWAERNPESGN